MQVPNLSLHYFKLADIFDDKFDKLKKDKSAFFQRFVTASANPAYVKAFETRMSFLQRIGDGFPLKTAARLTFGLGYQHPTEIGFDFDWTTGLPVIPGSSLKGAALAYAKEHAEYLRTELVMMEQIFGSNESSGCIVFLPAYPCLGEGDKFLDLDVMTPHYAPYYDHPNNTDQYPPADWYSPMPLPYLTVPIGINYCFRLADRSNLGAKAGDSLILKTALNTLKAALTENGVGAKTAVGYGYFA